MAACKRQPVRALLLGLGFGLLLPQARSPPPPADAGHSWVATLHDTFDGGVEVNGSLWTKGWSWCNGTGQLPGSPQPRTQEKASDTCWFGDENVAIDSDEGHLVLTNRREPAHGYNYTSGVVNSISYGPGLGFQQTYGYFEARIKPSPGAHNLGMCPAFCKLTSTIFSCLWFMAQFMGQPALKR